jgi:hypothetical protein
LQQLLADPARCQALHRGAAEHLARFTRAHVARLYLEAMSAHA